MSGFDNLYIALPTINAVAVIATTTITIGINSAVISPAVKSAIDIAVPNNAVTPPAIHPFLIAGQLR
ncbi:hypothetical protein wScaTNS_09780 [Wolbachia pipientis]|nr:hypothetical protein M1L25_000109 [Wolbachia endosymbiont of Ostrinia furnacalis]URG41188.1 hypothetical protein M1L26_000189 [Wolbachia endosymbiont of Ostrinia scapulalis]